jgi:hypothetical protein
MCWIVSVELPPLDRPSVAQLFQQPALYLHWQIIQTGRWSKNVRTIGVLSLSTGGFMSVRRIFALIFAATFAIAAHAAKPIVQPIPLGENLPVEVVLNQQEIGVDVSQTNAMAAGGGLLGALIVAGVDNARTKNAEERIVPIRDLLIAYRFNDAFEREVRARLPSEGITMKPVFVVQNTALGAIDAQNNHQAAPRAFVLTPRYALDNRFTQMTVRVTAQMVERQPKSNGKLKTVLGFNRTYTFQFVLPETSDDPEVNVKAWTGFGADALTSMLDEGVRQSIDMLVFDFSPEGRKQWESYDRKASVRLAGRSYPGLTVREAPEWVWARAGKGWLQAMNGYRIAAALPASAPALTVPVEAASPAKAEAAATPR